MIGQKARVREGGSDRDRGRFVPISSWGPRLGRRALAANEMVLVVVLLVLAIAIGLKNSFFWDTANLEDIARSTSFMLIVAVAMTFLLISGSLDLSVGSVYALGGVVAGLAATNGAPSPVAVAVGIAAGAGVGALNGFLVVTLRVPALIATLGTLYAVRGLVLVITGGAPVFPLPASFVQLGRGDLLGLPIPVWIAIGAVVIGQLALSRSVFGRRLFAIGGNERAAYLAGIPIGRIRVSTFILSGAAASAAGILVAGRIASAQVNSGTGLELSVIAAVIIGGTSLFGGTGSVIGTTLGALLIAVIGNGLIFAEIDPFYQNIVIGGIIVGAVAVDGWRRRKLAER